MPTGADTHAGVLADDEEEREEPSRTDSEMEVGVYMCGQHSQHNMGQSGVIN